MSNVRIIVLGLMAGFASFSIDLFQPAGVSLAETFNVDAASVSLNVSLFLIGIAIGQFVGGPISDFLGRRRLLLVSTVFFCCTNLALMWVDGFEVYLGLRLLSAVCAGMVSVLVDAIIADENDASGTARLLSSTTIVAIAARLLSPVLGAYLVVQFGWQALPLICVVIAMGCGVYAWRHIAETHHNRPEDAHFVRDTTLRYGKIVSNPQTRAYVGYEVFSSIGLFSIVSDAAYTYVEGFGLSTLEFGYFYSLFSLVLIVAAFINTRLVRRMGVDDLLRISIPLAALVTSVFALCVATFGLSVEVFSIMLFAYVLPMMMTRLNALAGALKTLPEDAGTVSAVSNTLSFGVGGIVGSQIGGLLEYSDNALVFLLCASAIMNLGLFGYVESRRRVAAT